MLLAVTARGGMLTKDYCYYLLQLLLLLCCLKAYMPHCSAQVPRHVLLDRPVYDVVVQVAHASVASACCNVGSLL
jgi:hypothetical protein